MEKQHIIDEIRRTAALNDGKPLGKQRFFKETGITETAFLGKFWSKWSDAIKEAGFVPNELQGAHDKQTKLRKVAQLSLRLGKFPTAAEMRLEKRVNRSFPQILINKAQLLAELTTFCHQHADFEKVIPMLVDASTKAFQSDGADSNSQRAFVYLMLSGKYHKIGITNALYRRASQIANGAPEGVEIIHSFETDDPRGIESYWHNRFADKRIRGKNVASGEWFALSAADIAAFKKRKSFM